MAKNRSIKIVLNWEEFDKLCLLQCTLRELAQWFECSEDTIERRCEEEHGMRFAEYWSQKAGRGKVSLRRKQFEVAMNGNITMLIWLGKNWLDQKDAAQLEIKDATNPQASPADISLLSKYVAKELKEESKDIIEVKNEAK